MYSAKSQQKLSPDTFNIEQVKTCTELCWLWKQYVHSGKVFHNVLKQNKDASH